MARFSKENIKAYLSYFSRGMWMVIGLVIIVGLIAAVYVAGNRKSDENQNAQTDQTATSEQVSQNEQSTETQSGSVEVPDATGEVSISDEEQAAEATPNRSAPNTGPSEMPNTGAEDWAPLLTTAVVLMALRYRKSRRQLLTLQQS